MNDIRNCRICGKIFNYVMGPVVCPRCKEKLEEKFQEVKKYIQDNHGADIPEVSEACDVDPAQIRQWIREDRLQFADAARHLPHGQPQMERHRRGKPDVLDVVFPQQARFARNFLRRRMQDESAAHRGNRHIRCPHVRVRAVMQAAEALFFLRAVIEFTADCTVIRAKSTSHPPEQRPSIHISYF